MNYSRVAPGSGPNLATKARLLNAVDGIGIGSFISPAGTVER